MEREDAQRHEEEPEQEALRGQGGIASRSSASSDGILIFAENMKMLEDMNKSWEDKLKEAQAASEAEGAGASSEAARKEKEAHILNVHEDPVLSKAIVYFFPPDKTTTFGNRNQANNEDILLGGLSIRPNHCRVDNEAGKLKLTIREDCKVLLNGQEMSAGVCPFLWREASILARTSS